MKIRIGFIVLLVVASTMLFAQVGGRGDSRVSNALDKIGLNYELDDDGDYQLLYQYDDGRSQLVWVSGDTEDFYHVEVREVFSYAYDSDGVMPANVARTLLQANAGYKIGAWELRQSGSSSMGIFTARIDADVDANTLKLILEAVAVTADEMEKELLGTDEW